MAKIKKTSPGPEIYGRLGDIVIVRGRYGYYAKAYKKPNNPQTEKQTIVRMRMRQVAEFWRGMENWQRKEWEEAAKVLQIKCKTKTGVLTGYGFFMKTNLKLLSVGCCALRECPF